MARHKDLIPFLLLFVFILSAIIAHCQREDRQLRECKRQCEQQMHQDHSRMLQCKQSCEQEHRQTEKREGGPEGGELDVIITDRFLQERTKLRECKRQCEQQSYHDHSKMLQCKQRCTQEYRQDEEGERGGKEVNTDRDPQARKQLQECKRRCEQQSQHEHSRMLDCKQRCEQEDRQTEERERDSDEGGYSDEIITKRDPQERLEECMQQCRHQGEQQHRCQQKCRSTYEESSRERGSDDWTENDPRERHRQCKKECKQDQEERQQRERCERRCQQEYQKESQRGRGSDDNPSRKYEKDEKGQKQQSSRPYIFDSQSFMHQVRSDQGSIRVLKKFHQQSKLLLGISNYRLAILEANPNTFVMPSHWDADTICYVVAGRGTITMLHQESRDSQQNNRESHDICQGDIVWIPSGTIVYLTNKDNSQKLTIAKLLQPVSVPGQYEVFYAVGGQNPESFFNTISDEVLEAAFNVQRDRIDMVFRRQNKGVFIRASQEQLREIGRQSGSGSGGGHWPFGGESSRGPFNLLRQRPTHSNQRGQLYEAGREDYQPLREMDIQVTFANISGGSMTAPFYNSKSTKIAIVTEGRGFVEIICPNLQKESQEEWEERGQSHREKEWEEEQQREQEERHSRDERGRKEEEEEQQEQGRGQRYQNVRGQLRPGTVFVVPPGHPTVQVASRGENLQIVCFEIRAENNHKFWLAGQNNVLNQMDRQAKELAFNTKAREVEQVLSAQNERYFLRGPEEREHSRGRLANILDFIGF